MLSIAHGLYGGVPSSSLRGGRAGSCATAVTRSSRRASAGRGARQRAAQARLRRARRAPRAATAAARGLHPRAPLGSRQAPWRRLGRHGRRQFERRALEARGRVQQAASAQSCRPPPRAGAYKCCAQPPTRRCRRTPPTPPRIDDREEEQRTGAAAGQGGGGAGSQSVAGEGASLEGGGACAACGLRSLEERASAAARVVRSLLLSLSLFSLSLSLFSLSLARSGSRANFSFRMGWDGMCVRCLTAWVSEPTTWPVWGARGGCPVRGESPVRRRG